MQKTVSQHPSCRTCGKGQTMVGTGRSRGGQEAKEQLTRLPRTHMHSEQSRVKVSPRRYTVPLWSHSSSPSTGPEGTADTEGLVG